MKNKTQTEVPTMVGWNVWILKNKNWTFLDIIFFPSYHEATYVKQCLIDHDGFDPSIEVVINTVHHNYAEGKTR